MREFVTELRVLDAKKNIFDGNLVEISVQISFSFCIREKS